MISPVSPIINTAPRSGIKRKTNNKAAFIMKNNSKIRPELSKCCFLTNHRDTKITYPILNNSIGWKLCPAISIHHLAPLIVFPNDVNTNHWIMSTPRQSTIIIQRFFNRCKGSKYAKNANTAITIKFLIWRKK